MDLSFSTHEAAFRDELREWLRVSDPGPEPPRSDPDARYVWARDWQRQLASAGYAAVQWPREYGGRGATTTESAIFFEELSRARRPLPSNYVGIGTGGATLMEWGTAEQKARFLPAILDASEHWCQAFSEPDAGSDLASLKTRAIKRGGDWIVTGQKVWTSSAQYAKWCMLLARTDSEAPKHRGLTYFIMDMEQPEVQLRPLRQITGEAEFNELFIDEARIPDENLVGGAGNGWRVALTSLMNERSSLSFFYQVQMRQLLDDMLTEAARRGMFEDPVAADKLAQLHIRAEILRLTSYRGLTAIEKHGQPGPEGSLTKWLWSDTNQQITQLAVDLFGDWALTAENTWAYEMLRARGNSLEGGTTEILKNVVAERVLGLPRIE
jgi:alkylation response protein AidB-like acyl-CoA dehydrogenase